MIHDVECPECKASFTFGHDCDDCAELVALQARYDELRDAVVEWLVVGEACLGSNKYIEWERCRRRHDAAVARLRELTGREG